LNGKRHVSGTITSVKLKNFSNKAHGFMSTEASELPIITKHSSELKADVYASTPAIELVICAVQILQADASSISAEEIVSTCFKLFPHRFALKNYFYWPDSAHVVQTLKYAKEKGYLKETPADGYILRPAGRQLARQAAKAMRVRLPMPPKPTVDDRPQTVEEKPKTVEPVKKKQAPKVVAKKSGVRELSTPKGYAPVISAASRLTPKVQAAKKKTVKTEAAPVDKLAVKKEAPKKITAKKAAPKPVAKKEVKQPIAKVATKPTPTPKKKPPVKPAVKKEHPKSAPQKKTVAKKETPKPAPTKKESPKVVVVEKPKAKKETPKPAVKKEAPKAKAKKAAAATQLSLLPQVSPKEEAKKIPPAKKESKKQVPPKVEVKPAPVIQKEAVSKEEKAKAGKVLTMVERSDAYRQYKKLGAKANISEFDFRNMLFATMESSAETLKRNLDLFKRYAGFYNRADLITFFEFCERGFAAMLQPSAKKKR
jgi:hypothetical protein